MTSPTKITIAAQVAHEANRALQTIFDDPAPSPAWDDAPEWQRASALDGVEKALSGLSPMQQHEAWCEYKTADGWQWGPIKDENVKTHPCLVPYSQLPPEQKLKDKVFVAVVQAIALDV